MTLKHCKPAINTNSTSMITIKSAGVKCSITVMGVNRLHLLSWTICTFAKFPQVELVEQKQESFISF